MPNANEPRVVDFPAAPEPPPYRAAAGIFVVVLLGYVWTLAPTVTFWDAGEFLAAAKIMGIPHPPGTPVFVLIANVWGQLVPIGEFAYRINLLTAVFSACAAAFMFLLVAQGLRGRAEKRGEPEDPVFVYGGAAAASLVSAYAFTVWQNSNEAEVYMVAGFSISAIAWLGWLWRSHRGTSRAPHILLVMVYLGAFSIGNHLLTLLVGPAVIGYMWHVLQSDPLPRESDRLVEWAQWAVVVGIWATLIGTGLGSPTLLVVSGLVFIAAAIYATWAGGGRFAAAVVGVAAIGVSTYLFLYIRAGLDPFINEADPSTWESLLAVIRREQYPVRLPIDNPLFQSGEGNPGRSLSLILLQIQNYLQYFDWQWSNGLAATESVFARVRLPFTFLFASLGSYGAMVMARRDRSVFWLILLTFLITGPGLVGYMNFKPGYSIGFDQFPDPGQHEVRERDYFFTVSFQMWGVFAGIGIAAVYRTVRDFLRETFAADGTEPSLAPRAAYGVFALALLPFALNFNAASRAHGPEARLARDFAYDLLQSIEPYGIVFTNGDNDTFPLWWAQEVEEIRQDVSVVNLSLANTTWYIRQLRDNPVRDFDPEQAPWYAPMAPETKPGPLHSLTDAEIDQLRAELLPDTFAFRIGLIDHKYPPQTPLFVKDVLILRLILENGLGGRPIYFSTTAGSGNWVQLNDYLTQHGLALKLHVDRPPDPSRLGPGLWVPVDLPRTDSLAWEIYRYAGLLDADSLELDPTNRNIASNLSLPLLVLGSAYQALGDQEGMVRNFRRAYQLSPSPSLKQYLELAEIDSIADQPPSVPLPAADTPPTEGGSSN